ncbi:hypothetical protein ACLMJK_009137 [Lecanora helva]
MPTSETSPDNTQETAPDQPDGVSSLSETLSNPIQENAPNLLDWGRKHSEGDKNDSGASQKTTSESSNESNSLKRKHSNSSDTEEPDPAPSPPTTKKRPDLSNPRRSNYSSQLPRSLPGSEPSSFTTTVQERKEYLILTPSPALRKQITTFVNKIESQLDPHRQPHECHLHPTPPTLRGLPAGSITCALTWPHPTLPNHPLQKIAVNWGILALQVHNPLPLEQRVGFINESWHMSHLCGNWTCCNWRHYTVEDGATNIGRNPCFNSVCKCPHVPRCLKERYLKCPMTHEIMACVQGAMRSLSEMRFARGDCGVDEAGRKFVEKILERGDDDDEGSCCVLCGAATATPLITNEHDEDTDTNTDTDNPSTPSPSPSPSSANPSSPPPSPPPHPPPHRPNNPGHFCPSLKFPLSITRLLFALRRCTHPTAEMRDAIKYLVLIKEDLERAKTFENKPLLRFFKVVEKEGRGEGEQGEGKGEK